ncbi:hypothetical protein LCGC14_2412930, partial [marine sediment metagenome]
MTRSLPPNPSLEHLKNEAKSLLKAHHRHDVRACATLRSIPALAAATDEEILAIPLALHDAQHAVATAYGFENWAALKAQLRSRVDQKLVRQQYGDSSRVGARYALHAEFSVNDRAFPLWTFDQYGDIPATANILELGSGPGGLWLANRDRIPDGWNVIATDASEGMVQEARANLAALGQPFSFRVMDAGRIDLPAGHFDAVLANHVLPNVVDLEAGLAGIARVLKPTGKLYAATNGPGHMLELRQLVLELSQEVEGMATLAKMFGLNVNARQFGLDTAPGLLREHFSHVEVRPHEDSLIVDQAQPLIDYVLSCMGADELPPE